MAFSYKKYSESSAVKKAKQQADKYKAYKEGKAVKDMRNQMNQTIANKPADWTGGTYQDTVKSIWDQINNREKFSYDLNGDALYQQYKQQYMTQGKLAMVDTMGQAAAMTGGYGSSYAETVGNQAYQGYLQQLNDVVPQLYQLAMNKYQMEGDQLNNRFNLANQMYQNEYGEYQDSYNKWEADRDYYTNRYYNEQNADRSAFESDRSFYTDAYRDVRDTEYGRYSDDWQRAFNKYQLNHQKKTSSGSSRKTSGLSAADIQKAANDIVPKVNQAWDAMISAHGLPNGVNAETYKQKLIDQYCKDQPKEIKEAVKDAIFAGKNK